MGFDSEKIIPPGANIKVIGVGGGGGNAVNTMIRSNLDGVEFIAANTDVQALRFALPEKKIQVGKELTKGLGAGADPDVGRDAALEDRHEIQEAISGADMVFITAGMGGGTGTGGASVIAQIAREQGALTVAVVTKPFNFEGKRRRKHAEMGIERLRESVDTLITIPNQRLLQIATPDLTMIDAFRMADEVLVNAVKGISDIINIPGTVNVDFADVKTVMSCMGLALMGIGRASGQNRAVEAARQAICSPLLEDIDIEGATGILINITASSNLSLMEVNEACSIIQDAAHEDANIIFGAVIDESCGEEIRVTVIATGFPAEYDEKDGRDEMSAFGAPPKKRQAFTQRYETTTRPISAPVKAQAPVTAQPVRREAEREYMRPAAPQAAVSAPEASAAFSTPVPVPEMIYKPQPPAPPPANFEPEVFGDVEALARMTMSSEPHGMNLDEIDHPVPAMHNAPKHMTGATFADDDLSFITHDAAPNFMDNANSFEAGSFNEEVLEPVAAEAATAQEYESEDEILQSSLIAAEPAPMETLFQQADASTGDDSSSFDKKIDEAIKLAEKLKGSDVKPLANDEELDIPAFLRGNLQDLSLD